MDAKDWYDCGARIGDLVQRAIDQQNFQSLNDSIMDTISQSVNSALGGVQHAVNPGKARARKNTYRSSGKAYENAKADAGIRDPFEEGMLSRGSRAGSSSGTGARNSAKGIFSMVAGYGMAIVFGLAMLAMFFLSALFGIGAFRIGAFFFMILTAVFAIVGARGGGYRSRMRQLEQYLKIMDGRDVITVEELASGSGKTVKEVQKDLRTMIQDGMFASEAYLDPQGTNLMTSRKAYRQYQETMQAYEERRAQQERERAAQQPVQRTADAEKRRAAEKDLAAYSDETRKILSDGRAFIEHIHACNEAIPEKEMTEKLNTLEQTVTRIFDQVAANPESAPDLHRMMSYYLPVTQKLVDAYVQLRNAGTDGENVTKTRQEIEMSLDTINLAFGTFLDGFYQDTAWDISSDISAMKTMMARDGLTQAGEFARTRKVGQEVAGWSVTEEDSSPASEKKAGASDRTDEETSKDAPQAAAAGTGFASSGGAAAAVMKEE